ncbi:MAG: DUF4389 domain-containing protein [Caldisericia bacterium]
MIDSPVKFDIEYPEKLSRGILLLKTFLGQVYVGIPHMFCLMFYAIAIAFVQIYVWFAILFTGKYPEKSFHFILGYYRWLFRVLAYWTLMMTDKYPPFTSKEIPGDPVTFNIEYPTNLSKGILLLKTFFGFIYVGIPHMFCIMFYAMAVMFVQIYVWFYILFKGKYPAVFLRFVKGLYRWAMRVGAWSHDEDVYPPFTGKV